MEMTGEHKRLALVPEILRIEEQTRSRSQGMGRPRVSRGSPAFEVKATMNFTTTASCPELLLMMFVWVTCVESSGRTLSKSVFIRAFQELARWEWRNRLRACVKLYLRDELFHHLGVDPVVR